MSGPKGLKLEIWVQKALSRKMNIRGIGSGRFTEGKVRRRSKHLRTNIKVSRNRYLTL